MSATSEQPPPQQQQETKTDQNQSQQQEEEQQQTTIIQINENEKEKKKVRRAFSMPRNPFRLSRRIKLKSEQSQHQNNLNECSKDDSMTNTTIISTITTMEDKSKTLPSPSTKMGESEQQHHQKNNNEQDNKYRMFRRSAWKKFLSRIAQQVTSVNIGVSIQFNIIIITTNSYFYQLKLKCDTLPSICYCITNCRIFS